jgi:hypothetical protein
MFQKITNTFYTLYVSQIKPIYPNPAKVFGETKIPSANQGLKSVFALLLKNPGHFAVIFCIIFVGIAILVLCFCY